MLFTSFSFFIFLIITLTIYYFPSLRKVQVYTLITASFIFYAYNHPLLTWLLVSSMLINIFSSYYVIYGRKENQLLWAVSGVVLNLLILFFFKYSPLFGKSFFDTNSSVGEFLISIPLPIGISFFTFQGISLVVDAYKGRDNNEYKSIVAAKFIEHSKTSGRRGAVRNRRPSQLYKLSNHPGDGRRLVLHAQIHRFKPTRLLVFSPRPY